MAIAVDIDSSSGVTHTLRSLHRGAALVRIIGELLASARAEGCVGPGTVAARARRTARTILGVHGVEVRSSAPFPAGACIVVSNHVSYLDPLVVSSVIPCISIAKGETSRWPLVGPGLRALGVVFVRRGDAYSGAVALRQAWRALRGGASVLNFPEGTTSDGRSVGPFLRGIFGLASLTGTPVVPVRVVYDDDRVPWFGGSTFAPHYWRLAGAERVVARVRIGETLVPHAMEDSRLLARRARDAVAAL